MTVQELKSYLSDQPETAQVRILVVDGDGEQIGTTTADVYDFHEVGSIGPFVVLNAELS